MARSDADLFNLRITLVGDISLDWERVEQDPVFRTILMTYGDLETEEERAMARRQSLQEYLAHYTIRERFLRDVPATNGPGTLHIERIEST